MVADMGSGPAQTQAGYAHAQIRKAIINGEFTSGDRLLQTERAKQLNISVAPVREALSRLKEEGLIESVPHRGTTVAKLNIEQAEEIYAMRKLLEPILIRRNIDSIPDEDLARAARLIDKMKATDDLLKFTAINEDFHGITMGYDNSWTSRVVQQLAGIASPYVSFSLRLYPEQIEESHRAHEAILSAAADRDVERFIELEVAHLESTLVILRKLGDRV